MKTKVSVIIPVYNAVNSIENTINSVLNQTYTHLEVVVVNDCSTDGSLKMLERLMQEDERIQVYTNKENMGVAKTRNLALSYATGDYIAFLDSDDLWMQDKIEMQLAFIKGKKAHICYTTYDLIDQKRTVLKRINVPKQYTYEMILKENNILCSSVLVERKILKQNPFQSQFFHEDLVLWLELLKEGYKAVGIEKCLVLYAKGGRSSDKLKAALNRWRIYRTCEKLTICRSSYYFINYMMNGLGKYYFRCRINSK